MNWKWSNVPVPPQHVVGLIGGWGLDLLLDGGKVGLGVFGDIAGGLSIIIGLCLAIWSVLEVGEAELENPQELITSGPFAISRNPMYVAWTLNFIGLALLADSLWILLLSPLVAAYTHWMDVRSEERCLEKAFG
ncbi:MAG: methyltransferase family protein, partial [Anaerolineales bacterium]